MAGLVVAMGTHIAVHVGIDNAAVVLKSNRLLEKAKSMNGKAKPILGNR